LAKLRGKNNPHSLLPIRANNYGRSIEESVREDIALLKASPLIKKTTQIVGLSLDIFTGVLTEVKPMEEKL
jgi:carbonic anhydrase